jgi:hypothetical protein
LTDGEIRDLRQPASLMVHVIDLNTDQGVTRKLKDLAAHQAVDQRLARVTDRLNKYPIPINPNTSSRIEYCAVWIKSKISSLLEACAAKHPMYTPVLAI